MPVPSAVPSAGTPALALLASLSLCAVAAGQGADNCADAQVVTNSLRLRRYGRT